MIFSGGLCEKVLDGSKTQTRRRRQFELAPRYLTGRTYAVQPGRTKPEVARILVTSVTATRASEISEEDARAEGFPDRAAFLARWAELNPGPVYATDPCWRIAFELVR